MGPALSDEGLKAISQKSCSVLNGLGPSVQWIPRAIRLGAGRRRLRGFSLTRDGDAIRIGATVESDEPMQLNLVRALDQDLKSNVHPGLSLRVTTELVARGE